MKVRLADDGKMREYWIEHFTSNETWGALRGGGNVQEQKETGAEELEKMENIRACPQRHSKKLKGTACSRLHNASSPHYALVSACIPCVQDFTGTICSTSDFAFVQETEGRSLVGIYPAQKR